jgi:hypothetical protein
MPSVSAHTLIEQMPIVQGPPYVCRLHSHMMSNTWERIAAAIMKSCKGLTEISGLLEVLDKDSAMILMGL